MKNYNTFINEAILDKILNLLPNLTKILHLNPEELAKINIFNTNIKKSKNNIEISKAIKNNFEIYKRQFKQNIDKITLNDINTISNLLEQNLSVIYTNLETLSGIINNEKFKSENLFEIPELNVYRNIFSYDAKTFKINLKNSINTILTDIGKSLNLTDNDIKNLKGEETTEKLPNTFDINNFKSSLEDYLNRMLDIIYNFIDRELKSDLKTPFSVNLKQYSIQKAKNIGSKPENILKFYNFINNLDKEDLIKVRDTLANNKIINKADYLI